DPATAAIDSLYLHDALPIFATSNGGQWMSYPGEPGGIMVITEPSAGLGGGGGTVVVGGTSLDIAFAVCFAVGEEAMGADLFDTGDRKSTRLNSRHVKSSYAV